MLKIHLKEVSELRVQHLVTSKLKKALLQFYIKPSLLNQVCLSSEYTKVFGRTLKVKNKNDYSFLSQIMLPKFDCDPPESLHRSRECGDRPGQPVLCGEAAGIVGFHQLVSRPPL